MDSIREEEDRKNGFCRKNKVGKKKREEGDGR